MIDIKYLRPNASKVREVAGVFRRVANGDYDSEICRHPRRVTTDKYVKYLPEGETVGSHLVWYLVGRNLDYGRTLYRRHSNHLGELWANEQRVLKYEAGRVLLANALGLRQNDLAGWAHLNPDIWGNKNGAGVMFLGTESFNRAGEVLTLIDIADHWAGVADRLEALEETA